MLLNEGRGFEYEYELSDRTRVLAWKAFSEED
jgi:hypothetical protein